MAGEEKEFDHQCYGQAYGASLCQCGRSAGDGVEDWSVMEINAQWVRIVCSGANPPLVVDQRRHLEPVVFVGVVVL